MTPREARLRAVDVTRLARTLQVHAGLQGTAREHPRLWLAVADAFEVAADAWFEAALREPDAYEAESMGYRAGDANRAASEILTSIELAYAPRSRFGGGRRERWWR